MKNQNKRSGKTQLRGEIKGFIFAYFLLWLVLGSIFLVKVIPDSINVFFLQDNRVYVEENAHPDNYEIRDEAYLDLVNYNNSLINGDDAIKSFFFSKTAGVKFLLITIAIIPHCIVILKIINASDKKTAKKQALNRRVNQTIKAVR